ncbi:MIP/aquaporin family protein [Vagococcus humatus]|uniref:Aquaporin n=1 Tax=Vagococcus humatus TaxID=1889241 RepID=A0A429Z5R6_9ENTE|nr:MIP/aquaporin family protein [Vagococcus humatus]RST89040.1 aquaporin [Vagococcus humatus]
MVEYIGELLGTMILIALGVGVVASANLQKGYGKGSNWLYISLGWGFAVTFGVYVSSFIGSQGHLNPAITIAFAMFGLFPKNLVLGYVIAQFIGAFLGAALVAIHFHTHFEASHNPEEGNSVGVFGSGPSIPNPLFNFLSELIATFVFVYVLLNLGDFTEGLKPLIVGLLITSVGISLGSTTGYALNPARDFGPRLAYQVLPIPNKSDANWGYAWVPIVGPTVGAILACVLFKAV